MGITCFLEQKKQKKEEINKAFEFTTNKIKTIKNKYIINDIFSFLYENKKLELIKYNNNLEKILEIDINYFKQKSGKIIKGEKNGYGKEYNENNDEQFEGEYKMEKEMEKEKNIILILQ